jgi:hypothetical protein
LPTHSSLFVHRFAHRSFPKLYSRFRNHLKGKNVSIKHFNQRQLADRWDLSEATLERWRSEGIGPIFLKLQGQVRYRIEDIESFEADSLRKSTSEREVARGAA